MPNKRDPNKVHFGSFIHRKFHAQIEKMAKREGMENNRFGFVMAVFLEALKGRRAAKDS